MHSGLPFVSGIAVQRYLAAEEGLDAAYAEGCTHWYIDMSLPSELPDQWPRARRRGLAARARTLGLTPIIHGNFRVPYATEITELRNAALGYLRTELRLAADLNAPAVIIHGGAYVEPRPTRSGREATLARFISTLEVAQADATSLGTELWLENLSHYPRFRPFTYVFTRREEYAQVLARIPTTRFILDVGHANVNQSMALPALREFAPSIAALSLSNNDGSADDHLGLDHGTLVVADLLQAVHRVNWRGVIAFETRGESAGAGVEVLRTAWKRTEEA
ncbi:hypothetical protein GCM10012280_66200 [Wenjunlia tyrosinilytica]|uniref:Xylose isomerase-like TIM barrel domain-containing protein n=2 Tax=Wenjunlia tyrosinilytica TaxID=1544741 RepID=A0A918A046_9ACTN|nr:hypothetical protein GCM10012280_66200 [Wenjunlia tyrosinilytica]